MPAILQGDLRFFSAAQLLPFLAAHAHSGTLVVEASSQQTRVFIHEGRIAWAEGSGEALGVEEAILEVLGSRNGTFTFVEDATLPAGRQSVDLDVQPLVEEGLRREGEMQRILSLYPDERVTFRVADNPSDKISLTPEEFKLVFRIGRGQTLGELCRELDRPALELYPIVYSLEASGLIASVPASGSAPPPRSAHQDQPAARAKQPAAPSRPAPQTPPPPAHPPAAKQPPSEPKPAAPAPRPAPEPATPAAAAKPAATPGAPGGAPPKGPAQPEASLRPSGEKGREKPPPTLVGSGEAARIPDVSVPRKTLVGTLTGEAGTNVMHPLMSDEIIVGRDASAGVSIQDGSISTRHARITRTHEGFVLEDLKSRNGTYVNSEPVKEKRLLVDNDEIRFGKVLMTFNTAKEIEAGARTVIEKIP